MGLQDKLQTKLAKAFDGKLADAVSAFTGSYQGPGVWDPVEETTTSVPVTYTAVSYTHLTLPTNREV